MFRLFVPSFQFFKKNFKFRVNSWLILGFSLTLSFDFFFGMGEEKICADIQMNFVPPVGLFVLLLFFPIFLSQNSTQ